MASSLAGLFGAVFPSANNTTTRSGEYGPIYDQVASPDAMVGNFVFNATADVRLSTQFGANGTEFTGLLDVTAEGDYPAIENVEEGVTYNNGLLVGVRVMPTVPQVLLGVGFGAYGTEFFGTLESCLTASGCLRLFVGEQNQITVPTSQDLSAVIIQVDFEQLDGTDVASIEDSDLTKTATDVTFLLTPEITASEGELRWAIRDSDTLEVYEYGTAFVLPAAMIG